MRREHVYTVVAGCGEDHARSQLEGSVAEITESRLGLCSPYNPKDHDMLCIVSELAV
jgi:hypothetical protein